MKPTEQMKKVSLNLGTGDVGGGSHDSPEASRRVNAVATALAGTVGGTGVGGTCCPRLCLNGDPTQSLTRSANSSARARPSLEEPLRSGLICFIW